MTRTTWTTAASSREILRNFRKGQALRRIDPEFKSRIFERFLKSISQKNWGQYFTPRNVVKATFEPAHRVDPSRKLARGTASHGRIAPLMADHAIAPVAKDLSAPAVTDGSYVAEALARSGSAES